ncbi:MAG: hypothetical protein ACI3ZA_09035 [Alloprevotella sp.]
MKSYGNAALLTGKAALLLQYFDTRIFQSSGENLTKTNFLRQKVLFFSICFAVIFFFLTFANHWQAFLREMFLPKTLTFCWNIVSAHRKNYPNGFFRYTLTQHKPNYNSPNLLSYG